MPDDTLDEIEARWPSATLGREPRAVVYAEARRDIRTLIEMVRARDRVVTGLAAKAASLARPRCSTPSQEDTGSVSGWVWVPREPTHKMIRAAGGALSPAKRPTPDRVSSREKHRLRWLAMVDASPSLGAGATEQPGESARATPDRVFAAWIASRGAILTASAVPPTDAGGPGSASGPTAGDVERARSIIDDAANIVGGPEALREMLCKDIAIALASAREELLAQIREPSEELVEAIASADWDTWRQLDIAADACRDLTWDELLALADLEAGEPARQIRDAGRTQTRVCLRALADKLTGRSHDPG